MLTSHNEKKKKKMNEWNLEVPGWNYYIGVHKTKRGERKGMHEPKVPRRITGFLIERNQSTGKYSWFFHPPRSLGWIPTVKKKKKERKKERNKEKDPQTQNWMLKIHGPSYRSRVKPLANVCAVYVKKRQLVFSVNISTIHVCACEYILIGIER